MLTQKNNDPLAYTVRGHWPFPLDMLRHDVSRAASDADQALIDALSGETAPDRDAFQDVEINLVGSWRPNTARWESFGWSVPTDTLYAAERQMRQAQAREDQLVADALEKLTVAERLAVQKRMRAA